MSNAISTHVKNKVWSEFTKKQNSKNELKKMFLGSNPTEAYKKISEKLKKKLDKATKASTDIKSSKKTSKLSPKMSSTRSPKRSPVKSKSIITSPKRTSKKSPRSPVKQKRRSSINPFNKSLKESSSVNTYAPIPFSSFSSPPIKVKKNNKHVLKK